MNFLSFIFDRWLLYNLHYLLKKVVFVQQNRSCKFRNKVFVFCVVMNDWDNEKPRDLTTSETDQYNVLYFPLPFDYNFAMYVFK